MHASELIGYQLEASGKQIEKALEGLDESKWEGRLRADCMSPAETVAHLTECYIAAQKDIAGKQHEWGSYFASEDTPEGLLKTMRAEREKACESIRGANDENALKAATQYIVLHDAYHVGQLSAYRMGVEPEWDSYTIYN
ncbi:MAG TPA: DinB family protein [Fimbriimonadaceae bacterium]|nr:DinB family protein [Fimbriimonadaceae bacterium]